MNRFSFASLRVRLTLFVLLAAIPAFGLALFAAYEQREFAVHAVQDRTLQLARTAAADHQQALESARQLLTTLAQLPEVRNHAALTCNVLFAELLKRYPAYANLGAADVNGEIFCSALPLETPVIISGRGYFQRALQTGAFAIGESQKGDIAGQPSINAGLAFLDENGRAQGVVFASLDLAWLNRSAARAQPEAATLIVFDKNGLILARSRETEQWVGKSVPESPLIQAALTRRGEGTLETVDVDGTARLYAFAPLKTAEGRDVTETPSVFVSVGIPTTAASAEVDRVSVVNPVGLSVLAALVLAATWLFGDLFIVRRASALTEVTRQLGGGSRQFQTDQTYGAGEDALRRQADEMAAITRVSREIASVLDLQQVLDSIARLAAELSQADASGVYGFQEDGHLKVVASYGVSDEFIRTLNAHGIGLGQGAIGRAAVEHRPVQIPDTQAEPNYPFARLAAMEKIRAILAVPMLHNQHVSGGIVLWHRRTRDFAEQEIAFLQALAQQCVNAVENARLLDTEREQRQLAEALRDTAAALSSTLNFEELLDRILDNVGRVVPHDLASILLIEGDTARVVRSRQRAPNGSTDPLDAGTELSVAGTPDLLQMRETGQPIAIADTRDLAPTVSVPETRWIRSHIGAPIRIRDQMIGFLNLDSKTPSFFSANHAVRLQAFADQAAIALENARLLAETERRANEFAALYETTRELAWQQDLHALLQTIVERADALLAPTTVAMALYDPLRRDLELVTVKNSPLPIGCRIPLGQGVSGYVAETRQALIINDYATWEHPLSQLAETPISAVLAVPMLYGGELIGVLLVSESNPARRFTQADEHLLSLFAAQTASAVHNARLLQETRTRADQLSLLYDAGLALNSVLEPRALFEFLFKIAMKAMRAERAEFFRFDAARNRVCLELGLGYDEKTAAKLSGLSFSLDDERGFVGWVARNRVPLYMPDVRADPDWIVIDPQVRSALWVPIEHEKQLRGTLGLLSTRPDAFTPQDERLLALFANQAAVALENAKLFEELQSSLINSTRLYELSSKILTASTIEETARLVTETLVEGLGPDIASIHLLNAHGEIEFQHGVGMSGNFFQDAQPRLDGLLLRVNKSGESVIAEEPQLLDPAARAQGIQSSICLPLRSESGILGLLFLNYRSPHSFSDREVQLLSLFANQAALAVKRVRLLDETRQGADRLAVLNRIANAVNQTLRLDELLRVIHRQVTAVLAADAFFIALYDGTTNELDFRIQVDEGLPVPPQRRPLHTGFSAQVITTQKPLLIRDVAQEWDSLPLALWGSMKPARSWLGVPMRIGDAVIGIINVQAYYPNAYGEEEQQLLVTIADQVAVAIQNARLFEETRYRLTELEAVNRISTALRAAQTLPEMLPHLLDETLAAFSTTAGSILIYDAEHRSLSESVSRGWLIQVDQAPVQPEEGITGRVLASGDPYVSREFLSDPFTRQVERPQIPPGWGGACVPIRAGKQVIGVFSVSVELPREIQPSEVGLLTTIAEIAGNAVQRAKLMGQTQQRAEQLAGINVLGRTLTESLELSQIYERLTRAVKELLRDLSAVSIFLYNADEELLTCAYAVKDGERIDVTKLPIIRLKSLGADPQCEAIRTRLPVVVGDPAALQQAKSATYLGPPVSPSAVFVPMLAKGQVIGILQTESYTLRRFSASDAELLSVAANTAAVAIQNARLLAETRRRLEHIQALHAVDTTINASLDLRVTLNVLLDQIVAQLEVAAADVLLLDSQSQTLNYSAGRGFHSSTIAHTHLRLGEGYASRAVFERKIISVPNLAEAPNALGRAPVMAAEGFKAYFAVPLVPKGQVRGVLEIFHRTPFYPDSEWLDFLGALARHAAIAIDNAALFDNMQRSNVELAMAYDAVLEGWVRALDLRDQEPEGHTQRVVELTLRLARAMGLGDAELVHIRRGALLHDIGKTIIPDRILFKPGPLAAEEWAIIQEHPFHAYELLTSIEHLRAAIDIPYCHHEKWNGSGYPRGLKGEEIPLAARIFAVVDAWDTLLSERSYRGAWTREKARAHIKSLAGTHFDPQAVEAFLRMETEMR